MPLKKINYIRRHSCINILRNNYTKVNTIHFTRRFQLEVQYRLNLAVDYLIRINSFHYNSIKHNFNKQYYLGNYPKVRAIA